MRPSRPPGKRRSRSRRRRRRPRARADAGERAPQPRGSAQPAKGDAAPSPEAYGNRYDFIPGDKVLVFDDFSDTDVGEYPARWTVKDGGGNQVEVVQVGDRRFVKSRYLEQPTRTSSTHWLRYVVKGDMPKNFTIEFDADLGGPFAVLFTRPERVRRPGDPVQRGRRTSRCGP